MFLRPTKWKARNLPRGKSPHHQVIYAQTEQNSWWQSGYSGAMPAISGSFPSESLLASGVHFLWLRQSKEYLGGCMAKMIEFYIPQSFRKVSKWLPPDERGKLLEFPVAERKSA
jgi:hypothetical protein